jgi:hypothetical protein
MPLTPNVENARVDDSKLYEYLLSLTHPEGGPKARFFDAIGYSKHNGNVLRSELLRLLRQNDYLEIIPTEFGDKYVVEGEISDINGRRIPLLTVWVIDIGTDFPRLVSAYPL